MTLCWSANTVRSSVLTTSASASGEGAPESIPFGTQRFATKPMA